MPRVSIIVPNYNHKKFLKKRLESIVQQTYQDYEIILLDDASSDESVNILNEFSKINKKVKLFIVNKENSSSPFKQWDKGINFAQGELIWIAESDDWAEPTFLEKLVPAFSDKNIVLAYCASFNVDENDIILSVNQWHTSLSSTHWTRDYIANGSDELSSFLIYRNTINNASAVIFRKRRYFEVGSIEMHMRYAADWLLWGKLIKDRKLCFISQPLNYFRSHQNSTRSSKSLNEEFDRLRENLYVIKSLITEIGEHINIIKCLHWQWIFNKITKNKNFFFKDIKRDLPDLCNFSFYVVFYLKYFFNSSKRRIKINNQSIKKFFQ